MRRFLLLLLILVTFTGAFAQDTIQLMSGKTKVVKVIEEDYNHIHYRKIKKDGTFGRKRKKDTENVFAVVYKDSSTSQIYRKDSLYDNFWSVNEMKMYLEGRRQGRKHFRPYKTFILGVAVGTGVAMYSIFPPVIKRKEKTTQVIDTVTNAAVTINYTQPVALSVPIPYWEIFPLGAFVYGAGRVTNDKAFKADDQEKFQNSMFVMGYKESVINRQVYAAAGSSVGSFLVTSLGYFFLDPVED